MRGLALVVVGLLVACEDGVVLEVHVPEGSPATSVRLFVGFEPCHDTDGAACPGLAPPQRMAGVGRELLPGTVYSREPLDDASVREANVEGGVARFRIESGGGRAKLPFAVAIDNLGKSAAYIPELSLDGARRYEVMLGAAMEGALGQPTSPINVVEIWNQPTKMLPCMGFERWNDGNLVDRVFVVPADDPDCDEVADNECAPFAYKGTRPPPIEATTCIAPVGEPPQCRPGGIACDENPTGPEGVCTPSDYCLPSVYCDTNNPNCELGADLAGVVKCLFETPLSQTAYLSCSIGVELTANDTPQLCTNAILIDATLTNLSGVTCAEPTTSKLLLPDPLIGTAIGFAETVRYTSRDASGVDTPLDVRLRHDTGCKYKLELSGTIAKNATEWDLRAVFGQFWISRAGGPVRKLLIPIELHPEQGCATTRCTLYLDSTDALARCAR